MTQISYDACPNTIELSTPFQYPDDEQVDPAEQYAQKLRDFVAGMTMILVPARNIRLTLIAYCIATGVDLSSVFGTNVESQIAKKMGVSRAALNKQIKNICTHHDIVYRPSGKHYSKKEVYQLTNHRNTKHES